MAFVTSEINSYKVVRYAKGQDASNLRAFIHCYYNNENVASLVFYDDDSNIPVNNQNPGQRVNLNYPISAFAELLNVMQHEKPLYFGFITTNKLGYLSTTSEPVGEEEG